MSTDDRENLPPTEIARRGPGMRDAQRSAESETDRSSFDDLLERVLDVPSQERVGFVDSHCDDPEVRRELIELLTKDERLGTFLERPAAVVLSECGGALPGGPALPETIGPYRVLELLGEGGMGSVYLAEQDEPVERRLAVKVVRADLSASGARERFVAERQALARLSHPYIAQMYEAGATGEGFPYFAMELISGEPITAYCDRRQLSIGERLSLFEQVCEGVQHAHQRGILHRDLKPSNILVSEVAGRAVPKLIDFGIAKALDRPLTDVTQLTGLRAVGTPAYMSPESLGLDGHEIDVDTRTDVYALGVVLYELLAGVRPFDLTGASFAQIAQRLRTSEAPRLSARLAALDRAELGAIAENRGLPSRDLCRRLVGDFDWIVARATARERERRYGSVSELAADIERHLANEPVLAGPPSAAYRARKFVQRHRGAVAASAAALLLLVAFAVSMALLAQRVATERDRANAEAEAKSQVSDFLQSLFSVSDPSEARGESITARELLDRGAQRIETELADQPKLQAGMMHVIGVVYRELGLYPPAERLLTRARDLRSGLLGPHHPDTLSSEEELARLYERQGRYDESERLSRTVLGAREATLGADDPLTVGTLAGLANSLSSLGRFEEAERIQRQVLEVRQRDSGPDDPATLSVLLDLADTVARRGRLAESAELAQRVAEARRRTLGANHPDALSAISNLAVSQARLGRFQEAEVLFEEALEGRRRVLGEEHQDTLGSMLNLAHILKDLDRYEDAEPLERRVLEIQRRVLGGDHPNVLMTLGNLTDTVDRLGRFEEAEELGWEALDSMRRVLGADHPETLQGIFNLGIVFRHEGRYAEAETLHRQGLEIAERVLGEDHPDTAGARLDLATTLLSSGRFEEAERLASASLGAAERAVGPEHPLTLASRHLLGEIYTRTGRFEQAHDELEETLATRVRASGEESSDVAGIHLSLAELAAAEGDSAAAREHLSKAVALGYGRLTGPFGPWLDPLRRLPELAPLLGKLGFEEDS